MKFQYLRLDGKTVVGPVGLARVMAVAAVRIITGHGLFVVVTNEENRTGLTRRQALHQVHVMAGKLKLGEPLTVRDQKLDLILRVKRVDAPVYADPFRDVNYTAARIDAGVDYCGTGYVHPIGKARIVNRGTPSHDATFGNDVAVYELLEGPGKGKMVFFAENYENVGNHQRGDIVDVNTALYKMTGCIEIGWSDGRGSIAWDKYNYREGELSAFGQNMSDLLEALGAKAGLKLGRSVIGKLPRSWPRNWKKLL